jgi:phosphoglycolate phosphatase-like HAD superfamily hydrolase
MSSRLVLFDIDGTLVLDDGVARHAFAGALLEVYGFTDDLSWFDFSGRTDPQIANEVLSHHGWERDAIGERLPALWIEYVGRLRQGLTRERQTVLRGVHDLLARLAPVPEITLALLTGNIEPGARVKLAPWELNRFFEFGAFGSDSSDRTELPPIAVTRAREETGRRFAPREVVIIGDSIWDVRCGVPHDAKTIAVASGWTPAETLRAEKPDYFFASLEETDRVVEAILGEEE